MICLALQSAPQPRHRALAVRLLAPAALAVGLFAAASASAQHGGGMGGPGGGMGMGGARGGGKVESEGGDRRGGFMTTTPMRTSPQLGPPGRWWDDKHTVKALNLRTDQQRRMDDLFEANKGNLISLRDNLEREEQRLMTMPREDLQDETKVFAAIDRVTQARAELAKANAHVLLQLRKELDANQLNQLDKEIASR